MSTQLPETFDPETKKAILGTFCQSANTPPRSSRSRSQQPKSGDGYYVAVTWKIDEGEYEGRQVWQRITYIHSSEQAQTIGRKQLKDLCNATGLGDEHVEDVEVFLFKRAKIKVGIERDKDGIYDDKNKVLRIRALDERRSSGRQAAAAIKSSASAKPQPGGKRRPAHVRQSANHGTGG